MSDGNFLSLPTHFSEVPGQARTTIDRMMGNNGRYIDSGGVYKVLIPRVDATIVQDYQTVSQNLGLNSQNDWTRDGICYLDRICRNG